MAEWNNDYTCHCGTTSNKLNDCRQEIQLACASAFASVKLELEHIITNIILDFKMP